MVQTFALTAGHILADILFLLNVAAEFRQASYLCKEKVLITDVQNRLLPLLAQVCSIVGFLQKTDGTVGDL